MIDPKQKFDCGMLFTNTSVDSDIIVSSADVVEDNKSSLYGIIYSPNRSGFPSSDLSVSAERIIDPSIKQIISEEIQREIPRALGTMDDSVAMETIKSRFESSDSYQERMSNIIDSENKYNDDDEKNE